MKSLLKLLTTSVFLLSISLLASQAQDWPQWRGTNRDGKVTGFKAPQTWPQQLNQVWKVSVGVGDATPALVGNKLFVFTRQGDTEILQCLDASTGKQIWQSAGYPTVAVTGPPSSHPGPRSSPTVSNGKVITLGVAGDIACYDAATGKLIWRNEEYKGKVPQFFTGMSPIVSNGICVAHLGGPQTGQFVAFDLASGTIKWKVDGESPVYGSPVLVSADGTKQVVFQSPTKLISLNISDGKQLWELATPVGTGRVMNASSPVVDQNKIYHTGLNNGFNAIEIKKQGNSFIVNKLWTNPDFSTSFSTPTLKDGFLYALSNQGRLFCINASNGQTAWADQTAYQNFGSIIDAGSVIVALSSNSNMVVLKPDGKAFSQIAMLKVSDNSIYAHPILSGNRIFIKDNESLTLYTTN
jgi:outer membrane protein assembly factor BamB